GLSLVIGTAVVQALQECGLKDIKLKWPNDIVYHNRKLAGILIELKNPPKPGFSSVVIGIGLNLYHPTTNPCAINQAITDIHAIQALPPQRNRLAGLLLKSSLMALSEFQRNDFSSFIEVWHKLDSLKDKCIQIETAKESQEGIARGVNVQGQLCVDIDGKQHCFNSGEVRIRHNRFSKNC
ncbi:biotin--[acetyl-CoA-carboxylase] ligase, partial [Staphylococcus aureus]|nr:biotin--[acetyl-CoA-carboxylase] ligase [Staphylococcus aureus]